MLFSSKASSYFEKQFYRRYPKKPAACEECSKLKVFKKKPYTSAFEVIYSTTTCTHKHIIYLLHYTYFCICSSSQPALCIFKYYHFTWVSISFEGNLGCLPTYFLIAQKEVMQYEFVFLLLNHPLEKTHEKMLYCIANCIHNVNVSIEQMS